MKTPLIVSFVALALSAIGLGTALVNAPSSGSTETAPARPVAASPAAELLARVDALSAENRELRDRLALLEAHTAADAPRRAVALDALVPVEVFEAFRDEVRAALASRAALAAGAPLEAPEFKAQVADTLSQLRHEEAVQKVQSYHERRLERLERTMPKLDGWLELSPGQSNEMRTALLAQYEREAEVVRRWEAGEDAEVLGELKRADRDAHQAELAAFLTPEQLETFLSAGGK